MSQGKMWGNSGGKARTCNADARKMQYVQKMCKNWAYRSANPKKQLYRHIYNLIKNNRGIVVKSLTHNNERLCEKGRGGEGEQGELHTTSDVKFSIGVERYGIHS